MKLRDLTNPRHVYEGAFETYFIRPFLHHYADFRGSEPARRALYSLLAWILVTMGVAGMLMGLVGLMGPEAGFSCLRAVGILWLVASACPLAALAVRTSRGLREPDAGKDTEGEKKGKPRLLGVDSLLGISCLLFFALGLLMMVTTLDSGSLNPNATMTDEPDTAHIEGEYVTEEPIFTYQDEGEGSEPVADTLSDLTEPDQIDQTESYDPTLSGAESGDFSSQSPSDTIF